MTEQQQKAIRVIGLALSASNNCIITDNPDAALDELSWRTDHSEALTLLKELECSLQEANTDNGHEYDRHKTSSPEAITKQQEMPPELAKQLTALYAEKAKDGGPIATALNIRLFYRTLLSAEYEREMVGLQEHYLTDLL